jgi:hypothetical protein
MIDEATRLSQSNANNNTSLVDPLLEPFCYDTTSQTSKYKRSIQKNIDYRLPAMQVDSTHVKVTIPVLFDSQNTVPSRDLLSFMVVLVSDAGGPGYSNPAYRSMHTSIVSVIGGHTSSTYKRIIVTPLQSASGGISFGWSAAPAVFWGTGSTGSADIAPNSNNGVEDNITITWQSTVAADSWAYIIPLAGLRENQQDKMQYGAW